MTWPPIGWRDFDGPLAILGDGGNGQTWTVATQADGTFTIQSDTGNYASPAERHGPFYTTTRDPESWRLDAEGTPVRSATGDVLAMSLIRIFPPAAVKETDGPTMPLAWIFQKVCRPYRGPYRGPGPAARRCGPGPEWASPTDP